MKKVILAGNAVTASILYSYLSGDKRYEVTGVTVDDDFVESGGIGGLDSLPFSALVKTRRPDEFTVIMAMGYRDINRSRESMFNRLKKAGYRMESYIHPDAKVYTTHPIGEGCVILPCAVIEPHVRLGANSMVWASATLAHGCSVGDNCWIASGATISGNATVKRNCFIGVNATIVNKVKVEEYCIIGASALITRNTEPSSVHLARSGETHRFPSEDYVKFFGF
jgi:sugar O-acyltransferase (sialic acid O-acetyltransferase NeuD family)